MYCCRCCGNLQTQKNYEKIVSRVKTKKQGAIGTLLFCGGWDLKLAGEKNVEKKGQVYSFGSAFFL